MAQYFLEWKYLKNLYKHSDSNFRDEYTKTKWDKLYDFYYLHLRPCILRILGVICIALTLIMIVSEVTLFIDIKLCVFAYIIENSKNIYLINLFVIIPLLYTTICSLYGIFNLKVYGIYHISNSKNTDANSLLFLSGFMCRIGFPVCYNYLQMLKLQKKQTSLEDLLGVMDLFPIFGKHFTIFYPMILLILVLLNFFDIFRKISNLFGISQFSFTNYNNSDIIEEGHSEFLRSKFMFLLIL